MHCAVSAEVILITHMFGCQSNRVVTSHERRFYTGLRVRSRPPPHVIPSHADAVASLGRFHAIVETQQAASLRLWDFGVGIVY
jgi:hypothetical protein